MSAVGYVPGVVATAADALSTGSARTPVITPSERPKARDVTSALVLTLLTAS